MHLSEEDSRYLRYLRGLAIIGVVLVHLGGWIWPPYSSFLVVVVPLFFFVSGAVSYPSYYRSATIRQYLFKRITSLLVPYYLASILCILVLAFRQQAFPAMSANEVLAWLTIRPPVDLQGFPFGQTWFLHTLAVIIVASPLYFTVIAHRNQAGLFLLLAVPLIVSAVELVYDIRGVLVLGGHSLYKPAIHSFFTWAL